MNIFRRPSIYVDQVHYFITYNYFIYFTYNIIFIIAGTSLPTRKQLATTYLDKCYEDVKKQIASEMPKNICIVTDAWTNVNGKKNTFSSHK